jgi:ribosomal protein L11 methyltransferase
MRWAEISVRCAPEATEAVSYGFLEVGCGAVMMRGDNPVTVQASLPVLDNLSGKLETLRVHFARLPEFGLPALVEGITLRYAEEEDWANAWRQHFKPARVGQRLVIKPSWEEHEPSPGDLVLELDPGMAFGTGGHPTTQLCLLALEEHITPGMNVADVGTGSGILSLAAARLGASHVLATDIDPLARRVADENVARNGLADRIEILEVADFEPRAHDFDLVVANIVARTIIELAPTVAQWINPGGVFIASGIVEDYREAVVTALHAAGLTIEETKREDIWVCLTARRGEGEVNAASYARATEALLATVGNEWA